MNKKASRTKELSCFNINSIFKSLFSVMLVLLIFFLSVVYSERISHSVKSGISLCTEVIIPSVFPFIILSDLLYSTLDFSGIKSFSFLFEKTFKINRSGIYPFILGILCGFPLGVKSACELYSGGYLSKNEAERLIGFSNNTGPAFLVAGIGLGLRKSLTDGILLYAAMVLSAIITGAVFSIGKRKSDTSALPVSKRSFSLTKSIKNAGMGTLNICAYLTFFACAVGLLRATLGHNYVYLSIIPFLEIGSATSIFSKTDLLTDFSSLLFSAFAIGFSGLSVHLQALSYISETDLDTKLYFAMKLFQGIASVLITYVIYLII